MSDWSLQEVDLIIADYFSMLTKELARENYNKTAHRNKLLSLLDNRNKNSVEFKHPNISAVLVSLGLPFITGYKPRWHYQGLLEERIIDYVNKHKGVLEAQFKEFARTANKGLLKTESFDSVLQPPPTREASDINEPTIPYARRPFKVNYLEREQNNSALGMIGEEFVLQYERWQLIQAGKEGLADRIEWISKTDDSAGFDILSRNLDGTDKYIEVKTTKLSKDTPIFFSINEYEFSKEHAKRFNLYRLFNFSNEPKMFIVQGSYDQFCRKEPMQFKGVF